MTFSASPLTPEAGTDTWRALAERVVDAAGLAAAQIPSPEPLQLAAPAADPAAVTVPAGRPPNAPRSGSPTSRSTSPSGSGRCACRRPGLPRSPSATSCRSGTAPPQRWP